MKPELNKVSLEDLARRRTDVVIKATDWANSVIDNSFSKTVPNSVTNPYSAKEDLEHAHQRSANAVAHFRQISDNTLGEPPTLAAGNEPVKTAKVYDINSLDVLRQSVNNAFDEQPTPSPVSSGDVTSEKDRYKPTAVTTNVSDIKYLRSLRNTVNNAFGERRPLLGKDNTTLDEGVISSVTPIQPHSSPANPADFIIPEKEVA